MYNIDPVYHIPIEEISCPSCGERYGKYNRKVDTVSQECSKCVKRYGYTDINLVSADTFIESLGYVKY